MAENSQIEWCHATFNPWEGCTKISPGCMNCYAEARNQRFAKGANWGKGAPRRRTSKANWDAVLRWNKKAEHLSERPRVFCASLADWLDDEVQIEWLADLLKLIHDTPNLDWLLLTKRPENWRSRLTAAFKCFKGDDVMGMWLWYWIRTEQEAFPPSNVWIGTTVEHPDYLWRIAELKKIPAVRRFLSCEPLLADIQFLGLLAQIDWVICGGESGSKKRPMDLIWAYSLRNQCAVAGVPFFMKQIDKVQPIPAPLYIRQFPKH